MKAKAAAELLHSIHSEDLVSGLTHEFYRYPARFHPQFARAIITAFSNPGDTILDPFMGGGTAVVEALALGRRAIGVDINPIARFVTQVKSTPLAPKQLERARRTVDRLQRHPPSLLELDLSESAKAQFRNTPWWLQKRIAAILSEIGRVGDRETEKFLRCGLLKTAQWALDCKERLPTSLQLLERFCSNVLEMADQMEQFRDVLLSAGVTTNRLRAHRRLLTRSAIGVEQDKRIPREWLPVKLVVTSPPYPGVHVLYHRWQVRGRRETPAPFGIIQSPDGRGPAYFTFGHRGRPASYFPTLTATYRSIAKLLGPETLVVQLVSFADPRAQVEPFIEAMRTTGFEEVPLRQLGIDLEGRIWRRIPNRKWYIRFREDVPEGRELLIFQRLTGPRVAR